jgi:hypothetical protein
MSSADRDDREAKRHEQAIKRAARRDRRRDDAAWQRLIDGGLSDNSRNADLRWAEALERVEQFRDARGLLVMMVALGLGPDWVRERLTLLLDGKLPPLPSGAQLLDADKRLVAADCELRDEMLKRPTESYAQRLDRMARKHRVKLKTLNNFHNRRGGTFEHIERELQWLRAYYFPLPPDERIERELPWLRAYYFPPDEQ